MTTYVVSDATNQLPYAAVAYVVSTFADGSQLGGSGVVVGQNDLLTASHVVHNAQHGSAVKVEVYPGKNAASLPFGKYLASQVSYHSIDSDNNGLFTQDDTASDLAVLGFATALGSSTGWWGLDDNFGGGSVYASGYPGAYAGYMVLDTTTFTFQSGRTDLLQNDQSVVQQGYSGGPLWLGLGTANPEVVGIISALDATTGIGWAAGVSAHRTLLQEWMGMNDALLGTTTSTASGYVEGRDGAFGAGGVFVFQNKVNGVNFFTANDQEKQAVVDYLPGFASGGVAFSAAQPTDSGAAPVWRFYNDLTGAHFFTISAAEKAAIVANIPSYHLEGAAFYASTSQQTGMTHVFRFYNKATGTHHLTNDVTEYIAFNTDTATYANEGTAFYAQPASYETLSLTGQELVGVVQPHVIL